MQACACDFCLSGSFSALLIEAETPAFANAAFIAGASNWTPGRAAFVSGGGPQPCTFAVFFFVLGVALDRRGVVTPATARATNSREIPLRETFFKMISFSVLRLTGGLCSFKGRRFRPPRQVQPHAAPRPGRLAP